MGGRAKIAAAALCTVACGSGATSDPGLGSLMRVQGAQFVRGGEPAASPAGPLVQSITLPTTTIWPGLANKAFQGALGPSATGVALALGGDEGYWLLVAGVPDFATPTLPSFTGTASFAPSLEPGNYTFQASAVDALGDFGPPSAEVLTAISGDPAVALPTGQLVVTLTWDTESDLDLHVVDPLGNEIYHGDPSSAPLLGPGNGGSGDGGSYGYLDFDSNAGCVIDGLRREDVIWPAAPPSGTYLVRVDTPSLCGQPDANFQVRADLRGAVVGQASGVSLDTDTWGPHDRGAGELVLTFDVP
jgi:hypothetical protein